MKKSREELKQIFNDTKRKSWIANFTKTKTKKSKEQAVRLSTISVESIDTVTAAIKYAAISKTCILNMGSAKTAGGGVADGESAQEESLFRCSNLSETITQDLYPLKVDEALYTKNAIFFKDKDYNDMKMVKVDVVTIPAINLNVNAKYDDVNNIWVEGIVSKPYDYEDTTKMKIRTMLSLASKNKVKTIILGAWGCGVFKNSPLDISAYFYEILIYEKYETLFDNIVFAIINDDNSVGNNFMTFKNCFNG